MEALLDEGGEFYGFLSYPDAASIELPADWPPFPCLIWDSVGASSPEGRLAFARRLVAADCRYVVCGGQDCEAWHDAMDAAYLESAGGVASDEDFVMTTWHADESPDDVAFFFTQCAHLDDHQWDKYLAVLIGSDPQLEGELKRMIARHAIVQESS